MANEHRIRIFDDRRRVIAIFDIFFKSGWLCTDSVGPRKIRDLLEWLKRAPLEDVTVRATYPLTSLESTIFNKGELHMDIQYEIEKRKEESHKEDEGTQTKEYYVMPAPAELPDDGLLSYVMVESLFEVKDIPERSVLVFAPSAFDQLECMSINTAVMRLHLTVLVGVGGAEYSIEFDRITWNLPRVAYHAFINDLRTTKEINEALVAENMSTHDREKTQYSKADGTVRDLKNFTIASETGDESLDI